MYIATKKCDAYSGDTWIIRSLELQVIEHVCLIQLIFRKFTHVVVLLPLLHIKVAISSPSMLQNDKLERLDTANLPVGKAKIKGALIKALISSMIGSRQEWYRPRRLRACAVGPGICNVHQLVFQDR